MLQRVPVDQIRSRIFIVRGHRVMLSTDLAELYGVETKVLVQSVKRNHKRFPVDFMFQVSPEELRAGRGGRGIPRSRSPSMEWRASPLVRREA